MMREVATEAWPQLQRRAVQWPGTLTFEEAKMMVPFPCPPGVLKRGCLRFLSAQQHFFPLRLLIQEHPCYPQFLLTLVGLLSKVPTSVNFYHTSSHRLSNGNLNLFFNYFRWSIVYISKNSLVSNILFINFQKICGVVQPSSLILEHSHTPKSNFVPICSHSLCSRQPLISILSLHICLFWIFPINGII